MITLHELTSLLSYDPSSGLFIWLKRLNNNIPNWPRAGSMGKNGYVYISIYGRKYLAHRLAWFYVHGVWPAEEVDHKNLNPSDNAIENLRLANSLQNKGNTKVRIDNSTGFKGVRFSKSTWNKNKPYVAFIGMQGKQTHLGCFATAEEASARYKLAAKEKFGEFAR